MLQKIRYFFEFLTIIFLFLIFRILGIKISSYIGGRLGSMFGPFFRSKQLIRSNIIKALPNLTKQELEIIIKNPANYNYNKAKSILKSLE